MRRLKDRVEAPAADFRSRRRDVVPSGMTPSIASRVRRKSSLVGLNTTKWSPARGSSENASRPSYAVQKNGLSSVLKSARCGTAVPFAYRVPSAPDHVAVETRGGLDRARSDRSAGARVVVSYRAPALHVVGALCDRLRLRGDVQPGPERRVEAAPGSRRSDTRPRRPRTDGRGACASRARSSRRGRDRRSRASRGSRSSTGRGPAFCVDVKPRNSSAPSGMSSAPSMPAASAICFGSPTPPSKPPPTKPFRMLVTWNRSPRSSKIARRSLRDVVERRRCGAARRRRSARGAWSRGRSETGSRPRAP